MISVEHFIYCLLDKIHLSQEDLKRSILRDKQNFFTSLLIQTIWTNCYVYAMKEDITDCYYLRDYIITNW